jgi:hypothetical protein
MPVRVASMLARPAVLPTPETLVLKGDLAARPEPIARLVAGHVDLSLIQGADGFWLIARCADGQGLALRTAWSPGGGLCWPAIDRQPWGLRFTSRCPMGVFEVEIRVDDPDQPLWRCTTRLTPDADLSIPYWPRDLYPLGLNDDPTASTCQVLAAQRGLNAGVVFLDLGSPRCASALYFQNFTALNDYFTVTGTRPDGVVGGAAPELGYQPPTVATSADSPKGRLPAGRTVTISDAYLTLSERDASDELAAGRLFLDMLAAVYRRLERPPTAFRDWPGRARRTLLALERSSKITEAHFGDTYIRPYVDAEYPDSMVQLAVAQPLSRYGRWRGSPLAIEAALRKGADRFYDRRLGSMRRYLPDVGDDKNKNEVDSWYLYHPLANLGRYALEGDEGAKDLFFKSVDFAIKVARHFKYEWPIQFDVTSLKVIKQSRQPGMPGQSDVGGLYAYVMLQAHEMSGQARYLTEAKAAVRAMKGLSFDLLYQTNLTAWGAMACLKLYRATGETFFLEESYVLFAGFFHNTVFWESDIEAAAHYQVFLGATCLHDGPYMALYECFESFDAFRDYLHLAGEDLPESLRLLICEYGRYALSRAWFYYPDALPPGLIADKQRNGEIDRNISIPMEDLYADGQPPGQVGQEVYGCGAAFVFAMRATHRLARAPFHLFCDYPLHTVAEAPGAVTFRVDGVAGFTCRLRLLAKAGGTLPRLSLRVDGQAQRLKTIDGDREATLPAGSSVEIRWSVAGG